MAEPNRRQYRRVAAGVSVFYWSPPVDKPTREYLEGIASDLSLGGLFLATPRPLPKGSYVLLDFETAGDEGGPVSAKAVVRWRRRWRPPRGMGLEFVEIEGLGQRRLEAWVESILKR